MLLSFAFLSSVKTTPSDGDLTTLHTDKVNAEEVHQLRNNVTHLLDHVVRRQFFCVKATTSYNFKIELGQVKLGYTIKVKIYGTLGRIPSFFN